MEFRFDVERLLPDEITRVDNSLILRGWISATRNRLEYQELYQIINAIGEASSFAQGLNNVITTADKLQSSDHFLYLMKERDDSIGQTLVVGMLKIGRKKLFLLNEEQRTRECAPLCVLDFYIHESRQRRGYGRRLFDYMLREQNVRPEHMAVDKPSDKFLAFLRKHYGLSRTIPQINNFVVFDAFFQDRPITSDEAAMTVVSRSPRAASPERNQSPSGSRRSSTSSYSHSAGRPSNPSRQANSMVDILHGRPDRHTPAARLSPRYQTTLDSEEQGSKEAVGQWMRGPRSGGESPYSRTPTSYSASRTPSNTGSPLRTPWGGSPPRSHPHTPPTTSQPGSRKDSADMVDGHRSMEGSIAPTPATSPERGGSPSKASHDDQEDEGSVINQQPSVEEDGIVEKVDQMALSEAPDQSPGKTNQWSESVTRSPGSVGDRVLSPKGSTMAGVLREDESVHGHLKFHHHALW
ncbi:alpha-tubulin N-acetyltransferase-like isoform X3 [Penaeus japonicus]|uniref:alpha-tubulin N-acetyltransferase-like isoform X3 n=1 Tax=Penaeus japonicus TaxID=27405 RepID=UPI001C711054|nr:alpha-tubulin N-acetyltransferase-like isoform X3 [Penaeus japonicus]